MEIIIALIIVVSLGIAVALVRNKIQSETVTTGSETSTGEESKAGKKINRKIEKTFRNDMNSDEFFDSIGIFVNHGGHREYPTVIETKPMKNALRVAVDLPEGVTPDEFANAVRRSRKRLSRDNVDAEVGVTMTGTVFIDVFPSDY